MSDLCRHDILAVSCADCRPRKPARATITPVPRPAAIDAHGRVTAWTGFQPARMTPDQRNRVARAEFRRFGYTVESVSWIRGRNNAFAAIKCWPATDVAGVVELFSRPEITKWVITHIHIGRANRLHAEGTPQAHTARVYIAWETPS